MKKRQDVTRWTGSSTVVNNDHDDWMRFLIRL